MILLIIYICGYIANFILCIRYAINKNNYVTLGNAMFAIFISLFSWLSFVIGLCVLYGDKIDYNKIIYKRK